MLHHNRLHSDPVHLVYRLNGSIAAAQLTSLKQDYAAAKAALNNQFSSADWESGGVLYASFRQASETIELAFFNKYEILVHKKRAGPMFLSHPAAQQVIIESWQHIAKTKNLSLYAICVMSNHVHVIVRGNDEDCDVDLVVLMESHKKFTATKINKLQQQKGRRVWAKDFFDRDIRKGTFTTVLWYVLRNPVQANLTENPFTYTGTWFDPRLEAEYIKPYMHQW